MTAPLLLAIDPGPVESAWVVYDPERGDLVGFAKVVNDKLLRLLRAISFVIGLVVIEQVVSYGMPVGAEVFETVFWSGRFAEACQPVHVERLPRLAVKLALCHDSRARDASVRAALLDRYGGKAQAIGSKAAPGPLRGVTGDVWSALALAVAWSDLHGEQDAA